MSNKELATEGVQNEEPPKVEAEPTMLNVRSEGLKLDLVFLRNTVSGLTIDYQNVAGSGELQKWIKIVDGMVSGPVPSIERSIPLILGEAARFPASRPQPLKGPEEGLQENAEPTMLNVRSEGLKLDLVFLRNTVSGLTIDYQNVAGSKNLHKWLGIIDGMTSGSTSSAELTPQILGEAASAPASQPQPPRGEQEGFPGNDYRRIVFDAVDATLDTLGSGGKQTILSLLENRYGLREKDIPEHPRGFVELLEVLLGAPARTLERGIMSNIRKVAAAPGENLDAVVKSLKEHQQVTTPVEAAAADPQSIEANASPVAIATTEEQEKPSEEHGQNPDASEDPIPTGFRFSLKDPIPVRFTHNATYSTRRG